MREKKLFELYQISSIYEVGVAFNFLFFFLKWCLGWGGFYMTSKTVHSFMHTNIYI